MHLKLNATEKLNNINNDITVESAVKHLFGNNDQQKTIMNVIGSNYGSLKAIRFGS